MRQLQVFSPPDAPTTHELTEPKVSVGRLADNVIQIDEGSVSSHHAELVLENNEYHLHDLGSTNGTFVNGEPVNDAILRHGDEVRFGTIEAVFHAEEPGAGKAAPMPEKTSSFESAPAQVSARPVDFVNSSPYPRNVRKKDFALLSATLLFILAFLAFGYSVANSLMMQAPA